MSTGRKNFISNDIFITLIGHLMNAKFLKDIVHRWWLVSSVFNGKEKSR